MGNRSRLRQPRRPFHFQYRRNPLRCQPTIVSRFTITKSASRSRAEKADLQEAIAKAQAATRSLRPLQDCDLVAEGKDLGL